MAYNIETDTTKKSGVYGGTTSTGTGTGTVGVGKTGIQNNNQKSVEMAQRGSEHASDVVVVID